MSLDAVGRVEIIFFTANLFSFFWINGLKNSLLSRVDDDQSVIMGRQFFTYFLIAMSYAIIFGLIAGVYYACTESESSQTIVFILIASLLFNAPTYLTDAFLQVKEEYAAISRYGIWAHLLQFLLIGSVAWYTQDWQMVLWAFVLWAVIKWIYFLMVVSSSWAVALDLKYIKTIVSDSSYLILFALVGGCMEYIDGVLVERFFEPSQFAIFKYGAKEFPLSLLMVAAISSALLPLASTQIGEATTKLKLELGKLIPILFLSSALLMMVSPYLFRWVYSSAFGFSALIFNLYLLILITRILLPQIFIYAREIKKYLIYIGVLELIINVSLSLLLIPAYGMIGIVIATLVAYVVEKVVLLWLVQSRLDIGLTDLIPVRKYLFYSCILIFCFVLSTYVNSHIIWS